MTPATTPPDRRHNGALGEFFRYHGVLSPGVRLFRTIGFKAKSFLIGLAFVLPLLIMLLYLLMAAREQIDSTRAELAGISYVQPLSELIDLAQQRRTAAMAQGTNLTGIQEKIKAAFDKVQQRQAVLGNQFLAQKPFESILAMHQTLLQSPIAASADDSFETHTSYVASLLDLMRVVADGSQLSLDPDLDTFHMQNLVASRLPLQIENTARMRDIGTLILKTKEFTPQRRELIVELTANYNYIHRDVDNSVQQGIAVIPDAAKAFDVPGVDTAYGAFRGAVKKQIMRSTLGEDAAAFQALGDTAIDKQLTLNRQITVRLASQLQARIDRLFLAFYFQVGLSMFFVLIAVYMLLTFYKVMMGGLKEVAGHLQQITLGNLTSAPKPWGDDEAARLMSTLGEMQFSLRRIVGVVIDGSVQVQLTSVDIASASQDLSRRTEQAAASLEETAASMEQISATVKQTAETVAGVSEIVRANVVSATRGSKVMGQVAENMEGIRASSNKIGEIIGVIDSIAFQTNILALNAAVEAARAGEQGRGFAVVATEVRALAGRSAGAAKEIKALIAASIEQVNVGNKVVKEANSMIAEIVDSANKTAGLMHEIANATVEQSQGVAQVGSAVQELDLATRENAALVEQTATASALLSDEAQRLNQEISFFKIKT
ncbi:MAG: hypothetical protein H7244_11125 [Herminiimonas sp.]|nr:hypothetical protein [Herminiimonas sp.]